MWIRKRQGASSGMEVWLHMRQERSELVCRHAGDEWKGPAVGMEENGATLANLFVADGDGAHDASRRGRVERLKCLHVLVESWHGRALLHGGEMLLLKEKLGEMRCSQVKSLRRWVKPKERRRRWVLCVGISGSEFGRIGAEGPEGASWQVCAQAFWVKAGSSIGQWSMTKCAEMRIRRWRGVLFKVAFDGLRALCMEKECGCCW